MAAPMRHFATQKRLREKDHWVIPAGHSRGTDSVRQRPPSPSAGSGSANPLTGRALETLALSCAGSRPGGGATARMAGTSPRHGRLAPGIEKS